MRHVLARAAAKADRSRPPFTQPDLQALGELAQLCSWRWMWVVQTAAAQARAQLAGPERHGLAGSAAGMQQLASAALACGSSISSAPPSSILGQLLANQVRLGAGGCASPSLAWHTRACVARDCATLRNSLIGLLSAC